MKGQPLRLRYLRLFSLLLFPLFSSAQHLINIVDETGQSVPGVQVYSDDYTINMLSNEEGVVRLSSALEDNLLLNFTFTGFQSIKKSVQELRTLKVLSMESGLLMQEVVVVGRNNTSSDKVINNVTQITSREIQLSNPQTAADALGQHSDVYVQKSQMGGGSPVVRGFEANKVLLVVDGVRLNNAIYRSGHLQNAITIDNQVLERIEVIYGPGSLMYGSDALGGVVQFRTKEPKLNFKDQSINQTTHLMSRYASANQEKTIHADLELSGRSWGSFTSLSFVDYNDLKAGSRRRSEYPEFGKRLFYADRENGTDLLVSNEDPNLQVGTAYHQVDLLQKIKYKVSDDLEFLANVQFSTSSDIPRYDQLIASNSDGQLTFAEWYYGPQDRFLSSLRTTYRSNSKLFDRMIAIVSFQQIGEDRIDRRFGNLNRGHQEETVNIFAATLDFSKSISPSFTLDYGFEANQNTLKSIAYSENIEDGSLRNDKLTRYPDGENDTKQLSAYFLMRKIWDDRHNLSGGLRYNFNQVNLEYNRTDLIAWPDSFTRGLRNNNNALTASLGYKFTANGWTLRSMAATAFRAPNIDDIAKIRIKANEVSVPNLDLEPETSITGELTVAKSIENKYQLSGTVFYTRLSNAIVRSRGSLPGGSDILIDGGDTLLTFINTNTNEAKIYGVSLNLTSQFTDKLSFLGSWSYIKGRQGSGSTEAPLSHIPPQYGRAELAYKNESSTYTLNTRFNGSKPLSEYGDSTDNPELATDEGALSWYTVNFYTRHSLTDRVQVNLSVENIFDQFYRPFASGVAGAGRNWIISLNMSL